MTSVTSLRRSPKTLPSDAAQRPLVGRHAELEVLEGLLDGVQERGASLIVRGDPGVGKSTLLETFAAHAAESGWRVLQTGGTPSERPLPLAGLHKLLHPIMGDLECLPDPQRGALRAAFGIIDAPTPGIFLVGLATLTLLAETATARPLLVIVDDTHWLDVSTGQVLAFIARRLESDPLVVVAAGRHSDADPLADAELPELHLAPLDPAASAALLDAGAPVLGPQRRLRVLEAAAGNPLALVELPKAIQDGRVGDPSERLPMTARLERAFAVRASELQAPTRDLLLVAACNDSDSLAETLAAAHELRPDADLDGLQVAADAGLVELDGEAVRFRHPLVRSALQNAASSTARHAAHAALAEVLAADPDRAVWHRAACVLDCDDGVATELEESALRSERRGGLDSAITALQRSAQLTTHSAARGRRLLRRRRARVRAWPQRPQQASGAQCPSARAGTTRPPPACVGRGSV